MGWYHVFRDNVMDVQKQFDYWRSGAEEALEVAHILWEKGKTPEAMFFTHLALEKMLKARIILKTADLPPRIHNLVRLAEITALTLTHEQMTFLRGMNVYQMQGRYPEDFPMIIPRETAREDMDLAQEFLEWLKTQ